MIALAAAILGASIIILGMYIESGLVCIADGLTSKEDEDG